MSVNEIKLKLATLPQQELDQVVAYLFHLRHQADPEYSSEIDRRLGDDRSANWLSIDEFVAC
jgi:hypothetical protein